MEKVYPSLNSILRAIEANFKTANFPKVVIHVGGGSPLNMRDGEWSILGMDTGRAVMRSLLNNREVPWCYSADTSGKDSGSMAVIRMRQSLRGGIVLEACANREYLRFTKALTEMAHE